MATHVEMLDMTRRRVTVLADGVVVERYTIEHCDKCEKWQRADQSGFQKWFGEKLMWYCVECRR